MRSRYCLWFFAFTLVAVFLAVRPGFSAAMPPPAPAAAVAQKSAPAPAGAPKTDALGAEVWRRARQLADAPYENPDTRVPPFLRALTKEQWDAMGFRANRALWKNDGLAFEVRFYPPGFIYDRAVDINVVDGDKIDRLAFAADLFDCPDPALADQLAHAGTGFAGFSLYFPMGGADAAKTDVAMFLGASYFQSFGRNSRYGLYARGLALNTALPGGEEFPYFREFWLVKPRPEDESMILYALADSPSMTGAFRMKITPGTSTVMDVGAQLFKRKGSAQPQKIGLAPLTSMFLYSETANGKAGDYRPEVHNSDGFLYAASDGTWVWNALDNPAQLNVSDFPLTNPRGFGLMQRDDVFDHYQDIDARFDRRPSLWVEPKGDWGSGRLQLIEIPGTEDYQGNIVAFWVPDAPKPPAANGAGQAPEKTAPLPQGETLFSYRLYWMTPGVTPHELGRAAATRMARDPQGESVTLIIDFEGGGLNALPPDTGFSSVVVTPEQAPLVDKRIVKNPVTGGWRLAIKVRLPRKEGMVQSLLSGLENAPRLRVSAFLKKGENLPDPLTETWSYTFTP